LLISSDLYHGGYKSLRRSNRIAIATKEWLGPLQLANLPDRSVPDIGHSTAGEQHVIKQQDKAGLNGEIFRDDILEAVIELGRNQMELVPKNGGGSQAEISTILRLSYVGRVKNWATPVISG
jgi:hypothetical protein